RRLCACAPGAARATDRSWGGAPARSLSALRGGRSRRRRRAVEDDEFDAAILGAVARVIVRHERAVWTESPRSEAGGFDACRDQVAQDRFGTEVGEAAVVGGLAPAVGVPVDADLVNLR